MEAGVDFSFRSAFRDLSAPACAPRAGQCPARAGSWGLVNLLQTARRASRSVDRRLEIADFKRRAALWIADWRLQISEAVQPGGIVDLRSQMSDSVQIWASRLDPGKLPVKPVRPGSGLWAWIGNDDCFLFRKAMSATTQTLIEEIKTAPESVQQEVFDFLIFLKARLNAPAEGAENLLPLAQTAWAAGWNTPEEDEAWRDL